MEPGSQIQEGRYNGPPVPKGRHICSRGIYPTVRGNAKIRVPKGRHICFLAMLFRVPYLETVSFRFTRSPSCPTRIWCLLR